MRSLLLAPHNDDEVLFATFTLLRHRPLVVICFRSYRMADPSYPGGMPVEYSTRESETHDALSVLGHLAWKQWPLRDDAPDEDELEVWMIGLRDPSGADDWDHVFAPAVVERGHSDHNLVGEVTARVFSDVPITWYLTYTASGKDRNGTEVEYEPEWVAAKHAALACYASQSAHPATRSHFLDDIREFYA